MSNKHSMITDKYADTKETNQPSNISSSTVITTQAPVAAVNNNHQYGRIVQDYLLIWIDTNFHESNKNSQYTLEQLRSIVNQVNIFTDLDQCIDFLTDLDDIKTFLIVEETIGQHIVPLIHHIPHLNNIYILCDTQNLHNQWIEQWIKVKGVYSSITLIYEALQTAIKQCNQDSISMSFVPKSEGTSTQDLNQLEASFMYTQIFKDILLEMEYDKQSIKHLANYCRKGDYGSPINITKFENEYRADSAILWYTSPTFIYSMLNSALRTLQSDIIINMGFFIRDLHQKINELHQEQVKGFKDKSLTVYRGQGLSTQDFEKLSKTKGGLISFNNFLSTSTKREVSLEFSEIALTKTNTVGILFQLSIDASISSVPFAAIKNFSYFENEEEILFSMHSVFRIGEITRIDENNPLYEVELTLTSDDDQQLRTLTKHIHEEVSGIGWERIGSLLLKIKQFDKAEALYKLLLEQASSEREQALYYTQLGYVKDDQGDYKMAIWYYERGLEIRRKIFPPIHPALAISCNNIGLVYKKLGEYSTALSFFEETRKIFEKTPAANYSGLAIVYGNIANVYDNMKKYSEACSFLEKAGEILEKTLPSNHPLLATSYNNTGAVYIKMGKYSEALDLVQKALLIREKTLLSDDPDLAISYNNIGVVYKNLGEYSKALLFYETSLQLLQKTLSVNHPLLADAYNNIGDAYNIMKEYWKALSSYKKAHEILKKTFPENHSLLNPSYKAIGLMYINLGDYSSALPFLEKHLKINEETLPADLPLLASSYNNIAFVYKNLGKYSEALSFYGKALEIGKRTRRTDDPDLAIYYNNIGFIYKNLGKYSEALSSFEDALRIWQRSLPTHHPIIKNVRENIDFIRKKL